MALTPQQNPWLGLAAIPNGVDVGDLNPVFSSRMQDLIKAAESATGASVGVTSAYRSPEHQAQIYANYTQRPVQYGGKTYAPNGTSGIAAPPGRSEHQSGTAMDINPSGAAYSWMVQHAPQFGVQSLATMGGKTYDPPHFQLPRSELVSLSPQPAPQQNMSAYAPSTPPVPMPPPQAAINTAAPPQGLAALSAPSAPPGFNPQAADRMITGEFDQLQPTAVAQQPATPNFGQALSAGIGGALKALGGQASPTGLAGLSPKAYTGAGGILIPLLAMNGQPRNTYGDVANGLGLSSLVNGV